MDFGYLKDVKLETSVAKVTTSRATISTVPAEGASIRLVRSGGSYSAYPSAALVAQMELEYLNKDVVGGCGFDVVDTVSWSAIGVWKESAKCVFLAPVMRYVDGKKKTDKLDLFSACTYNADGTPKSSVLEQGKSKGAQILADALIAVFGLENGKIKELPMKDDKFIDIIIHVDYKLDGGALCNIPKTISSGDKKGKLTYTTRPNLSLYPITIMNYDEIVLEHNSRIAADTTVYNSDEDEVAAIEPVVNLAAPVVNLAAEPVTAPAPAPAVQPVNTPYLAELASTPAPAPAPVAAPIINVAPPAPAPEVKTVTESPQLSSDQAFETPGAVPMFKLPGQV